MEEYRQEATRERFVRPLKHVFDTGPMNNRWVSEFEWLFDLRDAALHAQEKPRPLVPHPLGTGAAQEDVDYSVESAERAIKSGDVRS